MRSRYGVLNLGRGHRFSQSVLGQRTSPYLQEKLVLLGVDHVFEAVPTLAESLLGISVSTTSVFRACQAVSEQIEDTDLQTPSADLATRLADVEQTTYGMVDGSFLLTQEGWQETKVGRVFGAYPYCDLETKELGWVMENSQYVAHRGHYSQFTPAFERLLPPQSPGQKVILSDGGAWIAPWVSRTYPDAVHILDLFHVLEKVAVVAQDASQPQLWFTQQKQALLESRLADVLAGIDAVSCQDKVQQAQIRSYLVNHSHQMDYASYRSRGWMISSGPIESAHRAVLQVRMKRSGQRWSERGCDKMLKLRVAYRSGKTNLITNTLRRPKTTSTQD
jgi:hypothetical protein